ncbi:nucleoid-structuring protein H-NS [Candidatus Poribacteria bacterium]|nr:nucleoid-structuring protein H-NS [Candidatus Poribacteria bacterium]
MGYRPEIKVLDCTVRDGGLMNDHYFSDDVVRSVYQACVEAGIDYMELGYKASKKLFSPDEYGTWKFCSEDDIRRIVGENESGLKLSVMADAERTDYHNDILPKEQSVLDMVRVATYIHQIPSAVDIIKDAADKGYETTCNIMAISTAQESQIRNALDVLANTPVGTIYVVDSFGSLYLEQIREFTLMYLEYAKDTGKEVGIHTHNNQQLAYANTIEALILGANRLDGSMAGLGRGAGNCPMELLLGFLHNPKFKVRPILRCIRDYIEPLKDQLNWGFAIPYMITGQFNQHPRAAMKFMDGEDNKDVVAFFDSIIVED